MHLSCPRPRYLVIIAFALLLLTACQPVHPVTPEPTATEPATEEAATEEGAAESTPIPEVLIFIDDNGINVRTEFPNGIVAVTVENRTDTDLDVGFTRIPEGVDIEEIKTLADDFMGNLLPLLEQVSFMYSFNPVPAGGSGRAIIDFGAGGSFLADATEHSEGAPVPGAPHLYTEFQANWPNDAAPPQADVVVDMQDFSYTMPDAIPAGPLLWEFDNTGEQWHMAFLVKPNPGMTTDELLAALQTAMESEEEMSGPPPFEIVETAGIPPISPGERVWIETTLEPGEYLVGCPIPDIASLAAGGPPVSHFAHGMVHPLTVE